MAQKFSSTYQGSYGKFLETLEQHDERDEEALAERVLVILEESGGQMPMKALVDRDYAPVLRLVKMIELLKVRKLIKIDAAQSLSEIIHTPNVP